MSELITKMDGAGFDELIGGETIALSTKVVTIAAGTGPLKRGTLLGVITKAGDINVGKYSIVNATKTDGTEVADCVLAQGIATYISVNAEAYRSGEFNRQKLIVAAGDSVDAHEAELRQKNILMTTIR